MSALAVVTKPADRFTDDMDLVAAVRAGDDRAFELLFLRYQPRITAYVRNMVRDHERAEDIAQEVFIAALRRLRATEAPIAFKPWIYEIAKNACIDAFRRTRNRCEVSIDGDESLGPAMVARGPGPDAAVDAKLAIDNLCGALGGLSRAHHDILVMREFEDLTYREIGDRLGMSQAAVESTLFRARKRLSEEYEELVSGERCVRVRGIVDAPDPPAVGLRDRRRMARHVAHCQPCRRYAAAAGVDLERARVPLAARIAALLPLPTFLRRRWDLGDGAQLAGSHGSAATTVHLSNVATTLDPATVAGWPRAIAAAATVAVAGLGAGAAVGERTPAPKPALGAQPTLVAPALTQARPSIGRLPGSPARPAGSTAGGAPGVAESGDADAATPQSAGEGTSEPASRDRLSGESAPEQKPAAQPAAASEQQPAPGSGSSTPARTLPPVDARPRDGEGEGEGGRTPRRRPVSGLVEGAVGVVGGVNASLRDGLREVTRQLESAGATGEAEAVDGAAETATTTAGSGATATAGSGATTGDGVESTLGQVLGGGAGAR